MSYSGVVNLLLRGVAKGDPGAVKVVSELLCTVNVSLLTAEHAETVARLYKEEEKEQS